MSNGIDIYTLIFAALALFLFFKLRSILGTKTGEEINYTQKPQEPAPPSNVVPFPSNSQEPPAFRWVGFCEPDSEMAKAFDAIAQQEPSFSPTDFMVGAKAAYEMFTTSFNKGERANLKPHLSAEVFQGFENVMSEREKRGERVEFKFVGVDKAEITDARIDTIEQEFEITVLFRAQAISATYNTSNILVDGVADRVTELKDQWTFARKINARDPNWQLVGTHDVA